MVTSSSRLQESNPPLAPSSSTLASELRPTDMDLDLSEGPTATGAATGIGGDATGLTEQPRPKPITFNPYVDKVVDQVAEKVKSSFMAFIKTFKLDSEDQYYMKKLQGLIASQNNQKTTLRIDFSHLNLSNTTLADAITNNFYRFAPHLNKAIQIIAIELAPDLNKSLRLSIYNLSSILLLRQLKSNQIGRLSAMTATVTRTSEVRPELRFGKFKCADCGFPNSIIIEQQFRFTQPIMCHNPVCLNRNNWDLDLEHSAFADWQRVRVQENVNEIPPGSMPRTMEVILRDDLVEAARPGDRCIFVGCLIALPDVGQLGTVASRLEARREGGGARSRGDNPLGGGITGLKALGVRQMSYRLAFLAYSVQSFNSQLMEMEIDHDEQELEASRSAFLDSLGPEELAKLKEMTQYPDIYSRLVNSFAPTIFGIGHEDIKKGILLQLFGGVHKVTPEGIKLRGDINVCIVGDPSTSKSQFLRYACSLVPRSVFTSGKASTAAGLTASVIKDEETKDFSIEAGALMLADNGLCAIDEFDKMDLADQVAIHEAMEQQTISIAKAGIHASLNARTCILAAANPVAGRYNVRLTLKQNVNMSAPIMSRFDLLFVVLDDCNEATDYNVAQHIVNVHRNQATVRSEFSAADIKRYIQFAKTFAPKMTNEARELLKDLYRKLRQNDAFGTGKNSYRITVRQLESMIRLSEALAKCHCEEWVKSQYVREAYRLLQKSIIHVESEDVEFDAGTVETPVATADIVPAEAGAGAEADQDSMQVDTPAETAPAVAKVKLDREVYVKIRDAIVVLLQQAEEQSRPLRKSDIITWYLQQQQQQQQEQQQQREQIEEIGQQLMEKILHRLINKDNVLLELKESESEQDPVIFVHPNFYLDD